MIFFAFLPFDRSLYDASCSSIVRIPMKASFI